MKITWYGTASILLETQKTAILFDPYMKALPKGFEPSALTDSRRSAFKKQRTVFITHGHFDHLSSIKELYKNSDAEIYLTSAPYKTLVKKKMPKSNLRMISAGQTIELDGAVIRAVQGKHVSFIKKDLAVGFIKPKRFKVFWRGLLRTIDYLKYPEKGQTLVYEIQAEDKLVQIMGSAELDQTASYSTGADLLILPHQGRRDIDEHNKRIVEKLKPKKILLDHYDNAFPPYSALIPVDEFCKQISKTIPTEKLIEGQPVEI